MIAFVVTLCQRSRSVRGTIGTVLLPDGHYDALIVDATPSDAGDGRLHLEVTITTGAHKGAMVMLTGAFAGRDELDLLAAPATLVVRDGQPRLTLDA